MLDIGAASHIGKVRSINEDSYCIEQGNVELYIVADGMGGYTCGDLASSIAVETIKDHIVKHIKSELENELIKGIIHEAFNVANRAIYRESLSNVNCVGMGTTTTLALYLNDNVYIGHVGDSRAYIIKSKQIKQISSDHSVIAELVKRGEISQNEAKIHPKRNVITRALGTSSIIRSDIFFVSNSDIDVLMLCTDGLSNYVEDEEIKDVLISCKNSGKCSEELVELANSRGGYDNITVITVKKGKAI
ncbi:MAG: protein phosphatase [Alkaliphilus sp.]|nr:MAG: protein phosphatase [Alkaliphilus sp.]